MNFYFIIFQIITVILNKKTYSLNSLLIPETAVGIVQFILKPTYFCIIIIW
jgi:hypothetical protein